MTHTDRGTASPKHLLGNVQALRAIAAILVVLVHAALVNVGVESIMNPGERPWLTSIGCVGLCGVDLFFVISGFIMIVTNWEHFGAPFAGTRFFVRRIIRIYPPYWLAILPILPVLFFAKERFMGSHIGVKTGIIESLLLLPNQNKFILTVGWTLVWEMLFYVVFAFLLKINRKHVVTALAIWFIIQIGLYLAFTGSPNFYLNFIATPLPMEFIFGTVVGLLYINKAFPTPRTIATICIVIAIGIWVTVGVKQISLVNINDINRVLIFGLPAMLLVYAAVALECCGAFVAPRAVQAVGDGSYAIYLWHLSILVVLRQLFIRLHPHGPIAHAAILITTLAVIVLAGIAIYRYFEKPVTNYLNRTIVSRLPRRPASVPVMPRTITQPAD